LLFVISFPTTRQIHIMKVTPFLVLGWLLPVAAFRTDVSAGKLALHTEIEEDETPAPRWAEAPTVHLGRDLGLDGDGALIPDLVPPPGHIFTLESREKFDFIESNAFEWRFVSRTNTNLMEGDGRATQVDQTFAELEGGFFSNFFGHRRTMIKNENGGSLFQIHLTKSVFNPTRIRWSWRISHPVTEEVLFTINKDMFGAGILFLRDEWTVYRGRMRDALPIYYVVGGYWGYGHQFFKSKTDWRRGVPALGEASEEKLRSFVGAPTVFSVKVTEGQDAALMLATTVIINMVHETERIASNAAAAKHVTDTE